MAAKFPRRDIKAGFVYKTVPHVTLKSIANNPDIKEGLTRAQIDIAIRKHADTETLFDQPYEDKDRSRAPKARQAKPDVGKCVMESDKRSAFRICYASRSMGTPSIAPSKKRQSLLTRSTLAS